MQNPLSYIIGLYHSWRKKRNDALDAKVQGAASVLYLQMVAKHEQDEKRKAEDTQRKEQAILYERKEMELKRKIEERKRVVADLEERKQLADAWMPFNPKRMTKGQVKALTFFDELQLGALDVIEEEIRAELSNRAMRMDGVERDKAMWAAVGARRYLEAVKQKIDHFGGRKKREEVKASIEAAKEEKTQPRTMSDLYGERLLVTP